MKLPISILRLLLLLGVPIYQMQDEQDIESKIKDLYQKYRQEASEALGTKSRTLIYAFVEGVVPSEMRSKLRKLLQVSPGMPTLKFSPDTTPCSWQQLLVGNVPYYVSNIHLGKSNATIFLGAHRFGYAVAIKRCSIEEGNREVQAIGKGPNICTYFGKAQQDDNGHAYLVMELLNENISQRVKRQVLSMQEIVEFSKHLLLALQQCHGSDGTAHRDLKPANVMFIFPRHGKSTLKLIDFGVSKKTDLQGEFSLTRDTGTQGHRPPECASATSINGLRADLWSVGHLIYYMLSNGRFMYDGTGQARQLAINQDKKSSLYVQSVTQVRKYWAEFPRLMLDLIERLMKHDPLERISLHGALHHPVFWSESTVDKVMKAFQLKGSDIENPNSVFTALRTFLKKPEYTLEVSWKSIANGGTPFNGLNSLKKKHCDELLRIPGNIRNLFAHVHEPEVMAKLRLNNGKERRMVTSNECKCWIFRRFPNLFIGICQFYSDMKAKESKTIEEEALLKRIEDGDDMQNQLLDFLGFIDGEEITRVERTGETE